MSTKAFDRIRAGLTDALGTPEGRAGTRRFTRRKHPSSM